MDINVIVQYGTLAAAAVALWQVFYTRSKDRDEDTRWRTIRGGHQARQHRRELEAAGQRSAEFAGGPHA